MKYLVTGGSGFIGTNLVQKKIEGRNNQVTIVDIRKPIYHQHLKSWAFDWENLDIVCEDLTEAFKGHDVVIHLACQSGVEASVEDPVGTFNQNVYGTLRCLEAARKAEVLSFQPFFS